ncbi:deleted in malignant brain tumors 1 protein-like [Lytechinus variegatus]|uniref:deleted in malignant brain tumors 1 protein-like n=1 Tax=Lytechinus variegatus TaxID=7654 RepID=UPI001BB0EDE3|nr:deleted in malignant brain tumors 1 protein-like [Lytechinus variegatus]
MSMSYLHLSAWNGNGTVLDKAHKYIDLNIVYQKPAYGSDSDVDGYLLPDITSADTDQDIDGSSKLYIHQTEKIYVQKESRYRISLDPFEVRLVGGSNDAEGRVEVLHDGSWSTICDDEWDLRDARVVCRMLEFGGALEAPGSARFGQGSGIIVLDDLDCIGSENNLAECPHRGTGVHNCGHAEDAGAICYTGANPHPLQVRLAGGSTDVEGRVEVMHDGSWGTVCDINWDLRDARVVCRMLGYDGALEAPRTARFGQGSGRVLLTVVGCDGTEDNLADCAHAGIGDWSYCGHGRDAGAVCYSGVRLAGGSTDVEGRVEIMHDGSWGTVCDTSWDLRDARVVCRMLGFDGALDAPRSAMFGQGSGRVLLMYVNCEGTEDNLADCAHAGIDRYPCSHSRDAGAICYSEGSGRLCLLLINYLSIKTICL